MPDFDITTKSGEEFTFGGQITKPPAPNAAPPWPNYPTVATGHRILFTAKRKKNDAQPLVQHDNLAIGGMTLADGGAWTVTIQDTDTHAFTQTELLEYDVALIEPSGAQTVVSEGTWAVEKSVGL